MGYTKTNDYTGKQYECTCDYSYTCRECSKVREEFAKRACEKAKQTWIISSIQAIASKLEIKLDPVPEIKEDGYY